MSALVETEIVRRDLEKEIVGRRIEDVEVRPGSNAMKIIPRHGRRKEFQDVLAGAKVERIERVGAKLLIELDNGQALVVDLGSSGRLHMTSGAEPMAPHTHLVIAFDGGRQLRAIDPKLSSEVFIVPIGELDVLKKELRDFILDPLADQFTWHQFSALLGRRDATLRDVLTDETFIASLGPLYADEVLWQAGLRPDRSSSKLSTQDVRRLYRSLLELLQEALAARGTSWGEGGFRDLAGAPGQFQQELKVYERDGESCRRCRSPIVKENVGDGYAYLCPQCQS